MPLGHATGGYVLDPEKLHKADILIRVKKDLGENDFNEVKNKISHFIKIANFLENRGYTTFSMLMGEKGKMPEVDFSFCWDIVWKYYPDDNHCKRVLGTILMHCFALEDRSWLFVDDIDKSRKLSDEEIPLATQYFLHYNISVYNGYRWPPGLKEKYSKKNSLGELAGKFNRK